MAVYAVTRIKADGKVFEEGEAVTGLDKDTVKQLTGLDKDTVKQLADSGALTNKRPSRDDEPSEEETPPAEPEA